MGRMPEIVDDANLNPTRQEGRTFGFEKRHNHRLPADISEGELKRLLFPPSVYGTDSIRRLQGVSRAFGRRGIR